MTVTTLPTNPAPIDQLDWSMQRRGGPLKPLVGGVVQQVFRLGDSFAVSGQLPMMDNNCARAWRVALLKQTQGIKVRWALPAAAYGLAGAGTPLVAGVDQQGSTLTTDGWTADFVIPLETAFNVPDADGRPSLHFTTEDVTANGAGEATLTFAPMLRIIPADNAAIEVAAPKIEGWMNDCGVSWSMERLEFFGVPFAIAEDR